MAQDVFGRGLAFLRQDVSGDGGGATAAGGPRRRVCVSRAEPGCGGARVLGLGSLEALGDSHERRGSATGEALGVFGRWVAPKGWRAGEPALGRPSDPVSCPNSQSGGSCPRHEAAASAGVREGVHSARLQQRHALPVPDQVPRGAGEQGTQPGSPWPWPWGGEGRVPGAGGSVPRFGRAGDVQIHSKRCTKEVPSSIWRKTTKANAQSTLII